MDIYSTYYMLGAVEELPLEQGFFKERYFPTDVMMDVFNTTKVLADYREGSRRMARFVVPRIGSLPVGRQGFSTYELEPAYIGISMPITLDQLQRRGFGESLMSRMTPEQRARILQAGDLKELSDRISRREEWLCCQTIMNNGATMRHETDVKDVYEDVHVQFYDGEVNPAEFKPKKKWTHSVKNADGSWTRGSWYADITAMVKMLTMKGRPATELVMAADVGDFLETDPWMMEVLDNKRMEYGMMAPQEQKPNVNRMGTFRFAGHNLELLVNEGTYEDENGADVAYMDAGSCFVTAPNCGRGLYGAVTQMERDEQWHTYAGRRVPQYLCDPRAGIKETALKCAPLMVPVRKNPWAVAKNVL